MRLAHCLALVILLQVSILEAATLDFNAVRDDQINRPSTYTLDAILPSGLVRDSLVLNPKASSFHPATADAAGFALLALSSLDYLGKLPNAEQQVVKVLSAYAGQTPGVVPDRSADGFFVHFMDTTNGAPAAGGWDHSYSPIGAALLVAGAKFAQNHFKNSAAISSLADQLSGSVDFNSAIGLLLIC